MSRFKLTVAMETDAWETLAAAVDRTPDVIQQKGASHPNTFTNVRVVKAEEIAR